MENNQTLSSTPKDVFLYLFNILTFYISVIGFIMLYVQYTNIAFPDTLNFYYATQAYDGLRVSTSILFIAVPFYLLSAWILAKDLSKQPAKRELKLRKWLTYFTLFISAITIVIDLITFIYNFLSGELSIRFFLKILIVLLVAAAVFGYYIWDLHRENLNSKVPKILAMTLSVVTLASIVVVFLVMGMPSVQRERLFDDQRIMDLQSIQNQTLNYWIQKQALPQQSAQLKDDLSGFIVPRDPQTKVDYDYRVISPLTFELCATFKTSNQNNIIMPDDPFKQNWSHDIGQTCFKRTIDPDLYKNNLKQNSVPTVVPIR